MSTGEVYFQINVFKEFVYFSEVKFSLKNCVILNFTLDFFVLVSVLLFTIF
jgi:hypothetical protein